MFLINSQNAQGRFDGDVIPYLADDAALVYGCKQRRIVHVNGMQYQGDWLRKDSLKLSSIIEGVVYAVYNQRGCLVSFTLNSFIDAVRRSHLLDGPKLEGEIGLQAGPLNLTLTKVSIGFDDVFLRALKTLADLLGWITDIGQCTTDWLTVFFLKLTDLDFRLRIKFDGVGEIDAPEWVLTPLRHFMQANLKALLVMFLSYNPAVVGLLLYLDDALYHWPMARLILTCHSQGNLIVSLALQALFLLRKVEGSSMRPTTVFALASPALFWPGPVMVRHYNLHDDIIPWLGGTNLHTTDLSEEVDDHDFNHITDHPGFRTELRYCVGLDSHLSKIRPVRH